MTSKSQLKRLCALDPQEMAKRLALAERVVEATRARLEVWTAETYKGVKDALEAYDAETK